MMSLCGTAPGRHLDGQSCGPSYRVDIGFLFIAFASCCIARGILEHLCQRHFEQINSVHLFTR